MKVTMTYVWTGSGFVNVMGSELWGCSCPLPYTVASLRLDHCWPRWVLRGLLLHMRVLPGATVGSCWVVEGIGWSLTISVTRMWRWRDAWGEVHWWACVVTWSWETHVRREGWTRSQRPTDTWTGQNRGETLEITFRNNNDPMIISCSDILGMYWGALI